MALSLSLLLACARSVIFTKLQRSRASEVRFMYDYKKVYGGNDDTRIYFLLARAPAAASMSVYIIKRALPRRRYKVVYLHPLLTACLVLIT